MVSNLFNGMFGKLGPGMCRLSINGDIAVKTSDGSYKTYNMKKGTLVNCANFVFNIGEEMFFVIPTNKVEKSDIILVNKRPKCVIEAEKNKITAIDYDSSEVKTILPERHIFMGNTYFYGKIVSMFGGKNFLHGKKGINKLFQFMMMNEMLRGMNGMNSDPSHQTALTPAAGGTMGGMSGVLPFMMMGGMDFGDMFGGMFDFGTDEDDSDDEDDDSEKAVDAEISDEEDE